MNDGLNLSYVDSGKCVSASMCLSFRFIWFPSIAHRDMGKIFTISFIFAIFVGTCHAQYCSSTFMVIFNLDIRLLGECPTEYIRNRPHTFILVSSIRHGYISHLEVMEDHKRKDRTLGVPT